MTTTVTTDQLEYALIMHQGAQPQPVLEKFLHLMLNYEYGIELLDAKSPGQSHFRLRGYGPRLSSIFVVLDDTLNVELQRQIEEHAAHALLFLLMPAAQVHKNESLRNGSENIYICTWEDAFRPKAGSLNQVVLAAFEKNAIESLLSDDLLVFDDEKQARIERRLQKIKTLPTLPDIVVRIMDLVADPESKVEDLEAILSADPAIVMKIFQIIHTPAFSGVERKEELTLNEAIVRLGLKILLKAQVGSEMVAAVASHHTTGNNPDGLVCLVHMADNLCKDLGMGYLADERGRYSAAVLQAFKLEKTDLKELKEKLQPIVEQTRQMVDQCMS